MSSGVFEVVYEIVLLFYDKINLKVLQEFIYEA